MPSVIPGKLARTSKTRWRVPELAVRWPEGLSRSLLSSQPSPSLTWTFRSRKLAETGIELKRIEVPKPPVHIHGHIL